MKKFHVYVPCGNVNIPLGIIYCDTVTKYPGAVLFSNGCEVVATLCGVEVEELEEREGPNETNHNPHIIRRNLYK